MFLPVSGFGFCEFANPAAALRAIRMLDSYEIASKKLVVKADSKTNEILNEYKGNLHSNGHMLSSNYSS